MSHGTAKNPLNCSITSSFYSGQKSRRVQKTVSVLNCQSMATEFYQSRQPGTSMGEKKQLLMLCPRKGHEALKT